MKVYGLQELVTYARLHSEFYRGLYKELPPSIGAVSELPIVDQEAYWAANSVANNKLLCGEVNDGIIFRSGGTTGNPKYSVYTREEWDTFTEVFGRGMVAGGLQPGERIANLFYGGGLYASFLFIHGSIQRAGVATVELPLGGVTEIDDILGICNEFGATTIAGVPTLIMAVVRHFDANRTKYQKMAIKKILYGGEEIYQDQREFIQSVLPGVAIHSIGYASVDAGLLGYAHASDVVGVHREFSESSIMEIIDDVSGEPILDANKEGSIVITNLTRKLMPVIRYPAGDRGYWVEAFEGVETADGARKFKLAGRSEEAARVGPVSVYFSDMERLIREVLKGQRMFGFQMLVDHRDHCDHLTVRVSLENRSLNPSEMGEALRNRFLTERKMFKEWEEQGKVGLFNIEFVLPDLLELNSRTGKMRRIIDRRS